MIVSGRRLGRRGGATIQTTSEQARFESWLRPRSGLLDVVILLSQDVSTTVSKLLTFSFLLPASQHCKLIIGYQECHEIDKKKFKNRPGMVVIKKVRHKTKPSTLGGSLSRVSRWPSDKLSPAHYKKYRLSHLDHSAKAWRQRTLFVFGSH